MTSVSHHQSDIMLFRKDYPFRHILGFGRIHSVPRLISDRTRPRLLSSRQIDRWARAGRIGKTDGCIGYKILICQLHVETCAGLGIVQWAGVARRGRLNVSD